MFHSILSAGSIGVALMALGGGFLLGSAERPAPTEYSMARELAGGDVRLLGLGCRLPDGYGYVTVIAHGEDFGMPCKEIRRLEDEQS